MEKFNSLQTLSYIKILISFAFYMVFSGCQTSVVLTSDPPGSNIFDEESLEPLTFFAAQAAVAIENALLNAGLEAQVAGRTAELASAKHQIEHAWQHALGVDHAH